MQVRRLGGAYGGKISRSVQIACVCALVCRKLNLPARLVMSLEDNMRSIGKRVSAIMEYDLGTDSKGVIQYQNATYYGNKGSSLNESHALDTISFFFNCYETSTWKSIGYDVLTDIPANTWCRAPGETLLNNYFICLLKQFLGGGTILKYFYCY